MRLHNCLHLVESDEARALSGKVRSVVPCSALSRAFIEDSKTTFFSRWRFLHDQIFDEMLRQGLKCPG